MTVPDVPTKWFAELGPTSVRMRTNFGRPRPADGDQSQVSRDRLATVHETESGAGTGQGSAGGAGSGGRPCPHCGEGLFERHCKYVCPNHGVVYDCSDPFWR